MCVGFLICFYKKYQFLAVDPGISAVENMFLNVDVIGGQKFTLKVNDTCLKYKNISLFGNMMFGKVTKRVASSYSI